MKASSGVDSTIFAGEAWIGRATVAAGETTRSELQSRRTAFQAGKPVRKSIRPDRPTDPDLPRFGDYVYVEELPEVVSRVQPDYPTDMRESGTVMVGALVGKDGRVMDTRIVKSIPPLDSAALAAVRQWIFKPALVNQRPTAVWVSVPVKFSP